MNEDEPPLQFVVGRHYIDRRARVWKVIAVDNSRLFPITVARWTKDKRYESVNLKANGMFFGFKDDERDLISEVLP